MTRARAAALALAVLAAAAAGCGGISAGHVTAKSHTPESSYTTITTIGGCPCYPMTYHTPECWQLDLRDGDDTGAVCVPAQVWQAVDVGDRWPR